MLEFTSFFVLVQIYTFWFHWHLDITPNNVAVQIYTHGYLAVEIHVYNDQHVEIYMLKNPSQ